MSTVKKIDHHLYRKVVQGGNIEREYVYDYEHQAEVTVNDLAIVEETIESALSMLEQQLEKKLEGKEGTRRYIYH